GATLGALRCAHLSRKYVRQQQDARDVRGDPSSGRGRRSVTREVGGCPYEREGKKYLPAERVECPGRERERDDRRGEEERRVPVPMPRSPEEHQEDKCGSQRPRLHRRPRRRYRTEKRAGRPAVPVLLRIEEREGTAAQGP